MADAWCSRDPGRSTDDVEHALTTLPDVKVVYAYPRDRPNNFLRYADEIQRSMKDMSGVFAAAPGSTKGVRFDLGTGCGPQYLDIQTLRLTDTHDALFGLDALAISSRLEIFGGLRDAGLENPGRPRNYIVFLDGLFNGTAAGVAPQPGDVRPGPNNYLNRGGRMAFVFGHGDDSSPYRFYGDFNEFDRPWWKVHVPLHELLHSIGAVLDPAPHSTGLGHCFDEWDVVCSDDGDSYDASRTTACDTGEGNLEIDCNDDDYFRPAGGLVDRHGQPIWNTYDSAFLCAVARCVNSPPTAAISTAGGRARTPIAFDAIGSADDAGIRRYEWDLDGNGSYETDTAATPTAGRVFDGPGARTAGVRVTDGDGIARTARTSFKVTSPPPPATAARLDALALAPAAFGVPKKASRRATTIRYSLDRPAAVGFRVARVATGRRSGKRCVAATRRNRKAKRCARYVPVRGVLSDAGETGANGLVWNGRLGRRALKPGRYRLTGTPAGGKPRTAGFRVNRR